MRSFILWLSAVCIGSVAACGSGGSDSASSSSSSSSGGSSSGNSSSGGSSSGVSSGGPDASAPGCAALVEEPLPPSAITWQGAPRCSVDGVCNVYPAPTAQPPSRIRAVPSGSTWAVAGDAVYSWNGTQGKVHNLDVPYHLEAIAPITDSDVWVVGEGSLVAHWNGAAWTVSTLTLGSALGGVAALATNDVWAVGNFGVVAHWTGGPSWNEVALPGSPVLHDVWPVAANDVWAAEWNGGLWHYDGAWSKVASAGTDGFEAVWAAPGDVWALGDDQLFRGNASSVAPVTVSGASTFGFDAIWGSTGNDVWVSDSSSMFHYLNGTWSKTAEGARWLTGRSASDVLAIGSTHVRRFDGAAWGDVFQVGFPSLNAAWRSPNGDIWFAGANRTILRMRNGELRRMRTTLPDVGNIALQAVWGSGDGDIWFGGSGGSYMIHVVNGQACAVKHPANSVSVLAGSAADDVWALSSGKGMHWDGTSWSAGTLEGAESIVAFSKTDAWATGGVKVQHWNGSAWSEVPMPSSITIDTFTRYGIITGSAANDVWTTVSQFGTDKVLHYDGTWTPSDAPGVNFKAVSVLGPKDVFMLDWNVNRWDGVEWKELTKFPRRNVSAAIATPTEVWIATTDGGVLRLPR